MFLSIIGDMYNGTNYQSSNRDKETFQAISVLIHIEASPSGVEVRTVDSFMPSDAQKCSRHLWLSLVIKSDMQVRKRELTKKERERERERGEKKHPLAPVFPSRSRERIEFFGIFLLPDAT